MYWSVLTFLRPDLPYALNSNPEQVIFCTQDLCNFNRFILLFQIVCLYYVDLQKVKHDFINYN